MLSSLIKIDFKASDGWLTGFKERHNIKEYVKHGEAGSTPISELPSYREQIINKVYHVIIYKFPITNSVYNELF